MVWLTTNSRLTPNSIMFTPNWSVPNSVKALQTTRQMQPIKQGGYSQSPYQAFNLGLHVGDNPTHVLQNRHSLPVPQPITWFNQVHGDTIYELTAEQPNQTSDPNIAPPITADACFTRLKNKVCAVMTADCLPILITDQNADFVAAIHCGWRGLQQQLISKTLAKIAPVNMQVVTVWLGPAIGHNAFEVGDDVKHAFMQISTRYESGFSAKASRNGQAKYLADIYQLAKIELTQLGIKQINSDYHCTYTQNETYFSYRKNNVTGRQASLIWLE